MNGLAPEHRDIHFLPEYGRIYRDCFGFTPFLAVSSDEEGYVLQSFVQRKLDGLPFLSGSHPTPTNSATSQILTVTVVLSAGPQHPKRRSDFIRALPMHLPDGVTN